VGVVGEPAVGKSSIISKFCYGHISKSHNITLGSEFHQKFFSIDGETYDIEIRDTAGQERFAPLAPAYLRGSGGVLVVYAINDRESFDKLPRWVDLATNAAPQAALLIFGNKSDLVDDRAVSTEEADRYCKEQNALFAEGSAETGEGVHDVFVHIIQKWDNNGKPGNDAPLLIPQTNHGSRIC
jgi:small GTP-binding protein